MKCNSKVIVVKYSIALEKSVAKYILLDADMDEQEDNGEDPAINLISNAFSKCQNIVPYLHIDSDQSLIIFHVIPENAAVSFELG